MFETTLLESTTGDFTTLAGRHRIGALFAGAMFEFTALGALLLAPFIHTLGIDLRRLHDQTVLLPPPPPAASIMGAVRERASKRVPSRLHDDGIIAPRIIPQEIARVVDEPAPQMGSDIGVIGGDPASGGVPGSVLLDVVDNSTPVPLPPPLREQPTKSVRRVSKVSEVQAAMLIFKPRPLYPPLAIVARIQGTVRLEAIIGADGRVQNLRATSGPPLLIQAALDAVSQWRYQPTLLNGEAVEVQTEIIVNFILGQQGW